jgi:Anaphase-promoting complex APC subunit CDC26
MALRRPPTRIELNADDITEYTDVSAIAFSCSELVMAGHGEEVCSRISCVSVQLKQEHEVMVSITKGSEGNTEASTVRFSRIASTSASLLAGRDKAEAGERIGITTRRR